MPNPSHDRARGEIASAISTRTVQLLSDKTGRGPTKARTTVDRDTVTVVMEDTLTRAERALVDGGFEAKVLDLRRDFQRMMRDDLVAMVEEHTGRKVRAFMSENHIDPDLAAEIFVLEPVPETG
jgi:uncharacterized protein YbcI